ncbi:MAG: tetratricopeptide repeat protein [Desulfobacteraceae bacterium]|nr:tetratricopeptide repeat protein [Desulfobacteraceae bacterium]MBC2757871.1 tetratricopeptide repeat protein [Desulfobacteraceae bacterium]
MSEDLKKWEITGIIALLIIILAIPFYLVKEDIEKKKKASSETLPVSTFVGRQKCIDCHKPEYDKWENSHHDLAMDVANETTVLADFNNATFEKDGIVSKFYKKDEKFFVHTTGPDGKLDDFEITHTFGAYPLQQYLVPFPGGRLQCLTIAWDVVKKKWYHLYPDQDIPADDWLHWTRQAQNWNGMCAECHSTNLIKGYDQNTDTYHTTFSEIDVSCEACHGPASQHVQWAQMPEMARPDIENYGLVVKTRDLNSRDLVELCARCHARRSFLGDYQHPQTDILDHMVPQLLTEGLYFPDGQILEEVYVYASFLQSKMYNNNVQCSDCHDVHSLKRVKDGNDLCLQCHRAKVYDSKEHHFHKQKGEKGDPVKLADGTVFEVGEGAKCEQCHMPGRYYMGIDYRPDHSIRVPRPDLSVADKTPNACNRCHADKTSQWSVEYMNKWYGQTRKPHYGTAMAAAREGKPDTVDILVQTADDVLLPVIVRATAVYMLISYPEEKSIRALERALADDESLVRHSAIRTLNRFPLHEEQRLRFAVPLLYDPVKAVRMEAAMCLSPVSGNILKENERKLFEAALNEYKDAMAYTGDFPQSRFNLGLLYASLGDPNRAEKHYKKSIAMDDLFYPAKVNLAMLYNQQGFNDKAEVLLKQAYEARPDMPDLAYSLGLLLAEKNELAEAIGYLKIAADGMPERARVHYNLGLLLQSRGQLPEAEKYLHHALNVEPDNMDYLYAMADHYMKRNMLKKASLIATQMVLFHPDDRLGHDLLSLINRLGE